MDLPRFFVSAGAPDMRDHTSFEQVLDVARLADGAGLDFFAGDHGAFFGRGYDALTILTAAAAITERALLKTSVFLLALRHPTLVALQCAMLDQLSRGRLVLGVGIGGEDPAEWRAYGIDPKTRARRTDEALQILRLLWMEEKVTFQGQHFQLDGVGLQPKPFRDDGHVPIHIGGRSNEAIQRAARFGESWLAIWISPRRVQEARVILDEQAAAAGRDPSQIGMSIQLWCAVGNDRDEARTRLATRMEGLYQTTPFEQFERGCPFGTAGEIAEFLVPYVEAGCAEVNILPVHPNPEGVVESAIAVREALAERLAS
jgi:probable F420-dependent oxidoreductase